MNSENKVFENLNKINVNDKTDKKGNLTYLSWAWAWAEVKKQYPDANYEIERFDGKPYLLDENLGYMVFTKVTINGLAYEMWLPAMDYRNQALKVGKATMTDINKTIMRCLTKNLAMHGLGLYIYAGEDLPEDGESQEQPQKVTGSEFIDEQARKDLMNNAISLHGDYAQQAIMDLLENLNITKTNAIKTTDFEKANQFISDWVAQ